MTAMPVIGGDRRRSEGDFELNRYWTWGWDGTVVSDRTFRDHYLEDDRDEAVSEVYLTGIHDRNLFLGSDALFPDADARRGPESLSLCRFPMSATA